METTEKRQEEGKSSQTQLNFIAMESTYIGSELKKGVVIYLWWLCSYVDIRVLCNGQSRVHVFCFGYWVGRKL